MGLIQCGRGAVRRDRLDLAPDPEWSRRAQRASHKRGKSRWPDRDRGNKNGPNQASHATASTPRMKADVRQDKQIESLKDY